MEKYEAYFSNHYLSPLRTFPRLSSPFTYNWSLQLICLYICNCFLCYIRFFLQFKLVFFCCLMLLWNCFIVFKKYFFLITMKFLSVNDQPFQQKITKSYKLFRSTRQNMSSVFCLRNC
jgi:hypothetical protein